METTNPRKAGALILNNLILFNEAAILMEQQITVKVFEVFQEITSYWITKNGWRGEAEWLNEEENIWMLPIEWHSSLDEDLSQIAVFWFGYENEDTESYSIADLCGCGQSRLGFFFSKGDSIKKSNWKINQNLYEEISENLNLLGFKTTGNKYNTWFLPVTLENSKLATAYENDDFDESMQPLLDSFDSLLKARPILDPLVATIAAAVEWRFSVGKLYLWRLSSGWCDPVSSAPVIFGSYCFSYAVPAKCYDDSRTDTNRLCNAKQICTVEKFPVSLLAG